MPAITLGLAEIEERLRALRRRLNTVTVLHAVGVSLSILFLVAAGLVAVGLRGDGPAFRVATWLAIGIAAATLAACAIVARRRWVDTSGAATLADQRGQLTDRLTTLVDLRRRPRPSRLAPVLIAQTLALGERWRPQRIVPRRVPRSLLLALLSLLVLTAAPLLSPPPPPAPAPKDQTSPPPPALVEPPQPAPGHARTGEDAADASLTSSGPQAPESNAAATAGEPQTGPMQAAPQAPVPGQRPADTQLAMLPDRLRQAIRSTLHADQADQGHATGTDAPGRPSDDRPAAATDEGAATAPAGSPAQRPGEAARSAPDRQGGTHNRRGDTQAGGQSPQAQRGSGDQSQSGSAPNAGTGSSPENLLGARPVAGESERGAAATFKLTITSFLRSAEEKNAAPHQRGQRGAGAGAAPDTAGGVPALNEQQLRDDALRKAEIPAEYEDIVRRVYSARGLPEGRPDDR
jgi:hypothetical protein